MKRKIVDNLTDKSLTWWSNLTEAKRLVITRKYHPDVSGTEIILISMSNIKIEEMYRKEMERII